jgi:SulP family sulfate permease
MTRIRQLVRAADPPVKWLVIDAQAIHDMDVTAAQRFAELHQELADAGVDVKIADSPRPFLEELAKVGLSEEIGSQDFFVSVKKAAEAFERKYGAGPAGSNGV